MIRYVSGDLRQSKAALLAHGVAPNDNFAQGLALSLRENWPALYKDFRHYCQTRHPKAG
jgi:O-acetyl-ADP-ribose deacetylase (regulator of RNase III)